MLHVDIYDDETGKAVRIGTVGEFVDLMITRIGSVATVMLKSEFRKKALSALDGVIQKARDNARR